jgi:membrane-associated phospholipid phosphatase
MKASHLLLTCVVALPVQAKSTFETYGDIGAYAIPAIAAGFSWYQDDQEGLKQFGYALGSTVVSVEVLKHTVDATRPNGEEHSFPSGHSALAFSGAGYLQMRYGWTYGAPAYVAAGAVGWSRVSAHEHYWRDVIAGAAIAVGFDYLFTTPSGQKLSLYPSLLDDDAQGIAFNYSF